LYIKGTASVVFVLYIKGTASVVYVLYIKGTESVVYVLYIKENRFVQINSKQNVKEWDTLLSISNPKVKLINQE